MEKCEEILKEELKEHDTIEHMKFCSHPFEVDGNSIVLTCDDDFLCHEKSKEIKEFLSKRLKRSFGQEVDISFRYEKKERKINKEPEVYTVVRKKEEKENEEAVEEARKIQKKKTYVAKKKKTRDPSVFFGSNVEGAVMPISDIVDEIGEVVIAGMIRSVEEREFSNGEKLIISFAITDFTDTIRCLMFVKKTKADKNVIPDKYNTGAKGNLKKVKLGAVVGGIQFTAASGNTKNSLDFYYNNKQVKGKIIFKDYDFSEYPVVCYNSQKVEQKINVTFINCKFSYFATDRACTNVSYEFQKCTFKNFGGSNASFDRCKFGGSYNDGLNPFQKINVKNSFFCDLGSVKSDKVIHSDGTQIYGWKGITAKDILYKNCRFEIPQIAPKGSKAGVNACIMLQLEYSGAESS